MKRITGLEYAVSADTKFTYKYKTYGSMYQRLNVDRNTISYLNAVGQKLL